MRIIRAKKFWQRIVGLIGKKPDSVDYALLIINCQSVHTFFMRFPIDILFIDENSLVMAVYRNVGAWRLIFGPKSCSVLEARVGLFPDVEIGQHFDVLDESKLI